MYIHIQSQKILLAGRGGNLRQQSSEMAHRLLAKQLVQPILRPFPVRQALLQLGSSGRGQLDDAEPAVIALFLVNPSAFAEQSQHASQGCRVQRQQLAEFPLRNFPGAFESHQNSELSDFDVLRP